MFDKKEKPSKRFAILTEPEKDMLKYSKPKIMLIDIKDDSENVLKKAGFNVASGTFGTPYKVKKSDKLLPVIPNQNLRNCEEKEVIIIDLMSSKMLEDVSGEKVTSDGDNDWWVKCNMGFIDPRPRIMHSWQNDFDRILNNGGIFLVFSAARNMQETIFGYHDSYYDSIKTVQELKFNNWSFLSIFDDYSFEVVNDGGEEIYPYQFAEPINNLLNTKYSDARFTCNIKWGYGKEWLPLAHNKFKDDVAGIIMPNDRRKGFVVILPQIKNISDFILNFVSNYLPTIKPEMFPDIEGGRWVERKEYEIPKILELKDEVENVKNMATQKVIDLNKQIDDERQKDDYLHDLVRETDAKLVSAVHKTFELLGFTKIVDVDKEKAGEGFKDEDLRISEDTSPMVLVEVKGVGGSPSDDDALQVGKHLAPRMKEYSRHDIIGLSIINHERHRPALERGNTKPFRDTILTAAKKQGIGLITGWDLFRLARGFIRNNWAHDQIKTLFYQSGRIDPIPIHYKYLGTIDEYWEKSNALSIKLEKSSLKKGDNIAYELPVDFVEEEITSLQLDGKTVDEINQGQIAGIKTTLTKEQVKKGIKVYKIS